MQVQIDSYLIVIYYFQNSLQSILTLPNKLLETGRYNAKHEEKDRQFHKKCCVHRILEYLCACIDKFSEK